MLVPKKVWGVPKIKPSFRDPYVSFDADWATEAMLVRIARHVALVGQYPMSDEQEKNSIF